ncbi:hypothetical protein NJO91_05395 [Streptomyces microflavus]|uniref:hypothetical protein n=1 Tax=Streptomyces microflavus TaxID=1919 RepID=UPI0029BCE4D4|nr:hypothetical protein [Streptomyces microflavus]MDX2402562.1 hypothetical protein [Streptomyces microflavus]
MNEDLKNFIEIYLNHENAYSNSVNLRDTLHAFNSETVENVRSGIAHILRDHSLSAAQFGRLTAVEFDDDESLERYLKEMYRYLFEDREERPFPPE